MCVCVCVCVQNGSKVVDAIKETGQTKRDQKDLEDQVTPCLPHTHHLSLPYNIPSSMQIDGEAGKKVAANLKVIEADLKQMRAENTQLVAQLKA